MSYMVMECHPGYVILLDEEGRFLKAANLHYEVGQTVYDPILLRQTREKRSWRWIGGGIGAVAACFLLFFGWSYYQNYMMPYSSIYLSINPQVCMELNRQGTVIRLTGTNDDGKTLLEGYDGKGKDKNTVAGELIDRAVEMGFLSEGGRVSFSIDAPDELLFQEYGVELRSEVTEHLEGRMVVAVEIVDYKQEVPPDADSAAGSLTPQQPASSHPDYGTYDGSDYGTDYDEDHQDGDAPQNSTDYGTDYGTDYRADDGAYSGSDYGSDDQADEDEQNSSDYGSDYQEKNASDYGADYQEKTASDYSGSDYRSRDDDSTDYQDGSTDYDPDNK